MKKIALATMIALTSAAICAHAGTVQSRTVKFDDLNLDSVQGAQTLYSRITVAARGVCAAYHLSADALHQQPYEECMKIAISNAVAHLNRASLTAVALEKAGAPIRVASR